MYCIGRTLIIPCAEGGSPEFNASTHDYVSLSQSKGLSPGLKDPFFPSQVASRTRNVSHSPTSLHLFLYYHSYTVVETLSELLSLAKLRAQKQMGQANQHANCPFSVI